MSTNEVGEIASRVVMVYGAKVMSLRVVFEEPELEKYKAAPASKATAIDPRINDFPFLGALLCVDCHRVCCPAR